MSITSFVFQTGFTEKIILMEKTFDDPFTYIAYTNSCVCTHTHTHICDPASQNQQKVARPSFVLWLEIGDQGQHG